MSQELFFIPNISALFTGVFFQETPEITYKDTLREILFLPLVQNLQDHI